ncbi:MAG: hypothetical protein KGJ09_02230 [Candidatus Omnitrophica bacterium]|nr:hypothetical protein [Candidatus Omnitrophota bacterium]MDE2008876.1 hypothetical protein [Candidatus Omnitrophota bacterium]MDE2213561.1 hypothetical protein [Candidatus Omnitrophota bacterium]MDE2230538.1 hypothetical protein [Candidatus Omnitrophota bacterium]
MTGNKPALRFNFYNFFISCFVCLGIFFIFARLADLKLITADGSFYLSTAENIADHKGFVVDFNIYQAFNTLYHPLWAYCQPLYPVFCSLFIKHGGIATVILVNILFFALNMMLIFYIVQGLMPTLFNLLFISTLVLSLQTFITATYPLTEQFYFFCFMVTFILFLKFKDRRGPLFWLGVLNGVFMLIRVAHLFNFLAYVPVLFLDKGSRLEKFKRASAFAGGFILAYGLYQLFCLWKYHVFYPEYAWPAVNYTLARHYSGLVYELGRVGSLVPQPHISLSRHLVYSWRNLLIFLHLMPVFIFPAFFYYFLPIKKRAGGMLMELCYFQAIFTVLGYSATLNGLSMLSFEYYRYSMIPFIFISIAGWYCLYQGLSFLGPRLQKSFVLIVLLILILPLYHKFASYVSMLENRPLAVRLYFKDLREGYGWIAGHLPEKVLVASNEDQQGYFMHRPYISTPVGRSFNCANLAVFNRIYSPNYYFLSREVSDKCFEAIPHSLVFSNRIFRLLKVTDDKLD